MPLPALQDCRNIKLNTGRKLQTIPPKAEGGKLTQDFGGRVKKVSVKNFMLEDPAAPGISSSDPESSPIVEPPRCR